MISNKQTFVHQETANDTFHIGTGFVHAPIRPRGTSRCQSQLTAALESDSPLCKLAADATHLYDVRFAVGRATSINKAPCIVLHAWRRTSVQNGAPQGCATRSCAFTVTSVMPALLVAVLIWCIHIRNIMHDQLNPGSVQAGVQARRDHALYAAEFYAYVDLEQEV